MSQRITRGVLYAFSPGVSGTLRAENGQKRAQVRGLRPDGAYVLSCAPKTAILADARGTLAAACREQDAFVLLSRDGAVVCADTQDTQVLWRARTQLRAQAARETDDAQPTVAQAREETPPPQPTVEPPAEPDIPQEEPIIQQEEPDISQEEPKIPQEEPETPQEEPSIHQESPAPPSEAPAPSVELPDAPARKAVGRLPALVWPDACRSFAAYFEQCPRCAPFAAPGQRFVRVPVKGDAAAECALGYHTRRDRVTHILYALPKSAIKKGASAPEGYRVVRGADDVYYVFVASYAR